MNSGPNYSVPAQIAAQGKVDTVFWYNLSKISPKDKGVASHNLDELPNQTLSELPPPFNMPELVVFEGIYSLLFNRLIKECLREGIPYIFVSRAALTKQGQWRKPLKKIVGNLLYFRWAIKKASAIHYLTDKEYADSGDKWNVNHFIVPNGIDIPYVCKTEYNRDKIVMSFIGRLERYQKGLDILLKACIIVKKLLVANNVVINLYGPDRENTSAKIAKGVERSELGEIINIMPPVHGMEKEKVLLNTDVFLLTSRFEGMPMGLIEACAYGLPCLVTAGTNMEDDIKEYGAGWCAEVSPESVAEALKQMIADKEKFDEMGKNARTMAKKYDWDEIARKTHEKYRTYSKPL